MNVYSTHAMVTPMDLAGGRRRSQRACEMCSRKKTKCELEGSGLVCVQCARRNTSCVFPAQPETALDVQRYLLSNVLFLFAFVANIIPVAINM